MPVARRQPTRDQIPSALEIDDADVGALTDKDIPISPFERRARDGAMIADTPRRVDPGGNTMQQGQRSSSVSGTPPCIFSTFDGG